MPRGITASKSASSRMMFADLPPSSSATRLTVPAAAAATCLPAAGGTGEADHVDARVLGDRRADDGARAGDQVEDAGRKADLVDDLGEDERIERCNLGRLEHEGAAGRERAAEFADDLVQWVVPRSDRTDDADRLLHDEAVADRLFELEGVEQRGVGLHVAGRQAGLDHRRPRDRHADLAGDDLGDFGRTSLQRLVETDHVLLAFLDRGGGPTVERPTGSGDSLVDVTRGSLGDRSHHLFGAGVDDLDTAGSVGGNPGTVDVDVGVVAHPLSLTHRGVCAATERSGRRAEPWRQPRAQLSFMNRRSSSSASMSGVASELGSTVAQ